MSETTIRAYRIRKSDFNEALGSCSHELIEKILKDQRELLEECNHRLQNSYTDDRTPLDAKEAVTALINGNLLEEQLMEGACVLEAILNEIAIPLEDRSEQNSLWCNLYFWLEDFHPIFESLGFETLNDNWQRFSLEITPKGSTVEWPIWSIFSSDQILRCIEEFGNLDIAKAIENFSPELFTGKSSEEDEVILKQLMAENIAALKDWLLEAHESNEQLVILFDGDS